MIKPPIIINESPTEEPYDVSVYVTLEEAEVCHKHWLIALEQNSNFHCFDSSGQKLVMTKPETNYRVKFVLANDGMEHTSTVRSYLEHKIQSIAEMHGWDVFGVSNDDLPSFDIKQLVKTNSSFDQSKSKTIPFFQRTIDKVRRFIGGNT